MNWPVKTWLFGTPFHVAIARALQIDPEEDGATYALLPFRLAQIDGFHRVLAAYPCPTLADFAADDEECVAGIGAVLAWNPIDDTASVLGDVQPRLFGALSDQANALYRSPRAFFQDWMRRRAQFGVNRASYMRSHGVAGEIDLVPGSLVVGSIDKVRWIPAALPASIECVGIDQKALNSAILRAAHVPRAYGRTLKVAA